MATNLWTREELILAFNLYWKIPFGQFHHRNHDVIQLAKLMGRTPSAVAMRLSNFANVDPYHKERGIKGLTGGIRQVQPIWDEFSENKEELIFESEKILAHFQQTTIEEKYKSILDDIENYKGLSKVREVKTRINQDVFRQIVLVNYKGRCAITQINQPRLLIACHISPWAKDIANRLNPQNGILLNSLHDRAFENGFITIDNKMRVFVCSDWQKSTDPFITSCFNIFHKKEIAMPERFFPDKAFLERHRAEKFVG
jgi:putative restriction endonuclease